MPDPRKPSIDVETMPLDELRRRTGEVHRLLRAAREEVLATRAATPGATEARVARLQAIFTEVQELLPGLVHAGVEAAGVGPGPSAAMGEDEAPPPSLSAGEMARAKRILTELREGIERMDLLESIGRGIDELLAMIEATQGEARRQAERELESPPSLPARPAREN